MRWSKEIDSALGVVLASSGGQEIKSDYPKALAEVLFRPMVCWVQDACKSAGIGQLLVAAGEQAEIMEKAIQSGVQLYGEPQPHSMKGTPFFQWEEDLEEREVLVLDAYVPLLSEKTIQEAYKHHISKQNVVTLIRTSDEGIGNKSSVAPHAFWIQGKIFLSLLNKQGYQALNSPSFFEDIIGFAGGKKETLGCFVCMDDAELMTAHSRRELASLNRIARGRVLDYHMDRGVDIPFEEGVIIGPQVEIGQDTRILPGTVLLGKTRVANHCEIGPDSHLVDSTVGRGSKIIATWLTDAHVGEDTTIGPFAQLRPGTRVGNEVKIGDFVELKNTAIGDGTSIAHLTYIGDSDVGRLCNFGCGVVTANYDGKQKHRTAIGDRAFIGCNTNLISPVNVGAGAYTAAGTTVDRDVPEGALAVGRVRQEIKPGWADEHVRFKKEK